MDSYKPDMVIQTAIAMFLEDGAKKPWEDLLIREQSYWTSLARLKLMSKERTTDLLITLVKTLKDCRIFLEAGPPGDPESYHEGFKERAKQGLKEYEALADKVYNLGNELGLPFQYWEY